MGLTRTVTEEPRPKRLREGTRHHPLGAQPTTPIRRRPPPPKPEAGVLNGIIKKGITGVMGYLSPAREVKKSELENSYQTDITEIDDGNEVLPQDGTSRENQHDGDMTGQIVSTAERRQSEQKRLRRDEQHAGHQATYNFKIRPDDPEYRTLRNEILKELRDNSIRDVMDRYLSEGQIGLLLPASHDGVLLDIQKEDTKEYKASFQNVFRGESDNLATKITMLHFGLPVQPITLQNHYNIPKDHDDPSDSEDDFPRGPQRILYSEKPLEFLDSYHERSFGYPILRRAKLRGGASNPKELTGMHMRGGAGDPEELAMMHLRGGAGNFTKKIGNIYSHNGVATLEVPFDPLAFVHQSLRLLDLDPDLVRPDGTSTGHWGFYVYAIQYIKPCLTGNQEIVDHSKNLWKNIYITHQTPLATLFHDNDLDSALSGQCHRYASGGATQEALFVSKDNGALPKYLQPLSKTESIIYLQYPGVGVTYWKLAKDLAAEHGINQVQQGFLNALHVLFQNEQMYGEVVVNGHKIGFAGTEVTPPLWEAAKKALASTKEEQVVVFNIVVNRPSHYHYSDDMIGIHVPGCYHFGAYLANSFPQEYGELHQVAKSCAGSVPDKIRVWPSALDREQRLKSHVVHLKKYDNKTWPGLQIKAGYFVPDDLFCIYLRPEFDSFTVIDLDSKKEMKWTPSGKQYQKTPNKLFLSAFEDAKVQDEDDFLDKIKTLLPGFNPREETLFLSQPEPKYKFIITPDIQQHEWQLTIFDWFKTNEIRVRRGVGDRWIVHESKWGNDYTNPQYNGLETSLPSPVPVKRPLKPIEAQTAQTTQMRSPTKNPPRPTPHVPISAISPSQGESSTRHTQHTQGPEPGVLIPANPRSRESWTSNPQHAPRPGPGVSMFGDPPVQGEFSGQNTQLTHGPRPGIPISGNPHILGGHTATHPGDLTGPKTPPQPHHQPLVLGDPPTPPGTQKRPTFKHRIERLLKPQVVAPKEQSWNSYQTRQGALDDARQRAYNLEVSVVEPGQDLDAPKYGVIREAPISVGSNLPTLYHYRLTPTEIARIQDENMFLRTTILKKITSCQLCDAHWPAHPLTDDGTDADDRDDNDEIKRKHFQTHREQLAAAGNCPLCGISDWAHMSQSEKKTHALGHAYEWHTAKTYEERHNFFCPVCHDNLDVEKFPMFESVAEHLASHVPGLYRFCDKCGVNVEVLGIREFSHHTDICTHMQKDLNGKPIGEWCQFCGIYTGFEDHHDNSAKSQIQAHRDECRRKRNTGEYKANSFCTTCGFDYSNLNHAEIDGHAKRCKPPGGPSGTFCKLCGESVQEYSKDDESWNQHFQNCRYVPPTSFGLGVNGHATEASLIIREHDLQRRERVLGQAPHNEAHFDEYKARLDKREHEMRDLQESIYAAVNSGGDNAALKEKLEKEFNALKTGVARQEKIRAEEQKKAQALEMERRAFEKVKQALLKDKEKFKHEAADNLIKRDFYKAWEGKTQCPVCDQELSIHKPELIAHLLAHHEGSHGTAWGPEKERFDDLHERSQKSRSNVRGDVFEPIDTTIARVKPAAGGRAVSGPAFSTPGRKRNLQTVHTDPENSDDGIHNAIPSPAKRPRVGAPTHHSPRPQPQREELEGEEEVVSPRKRAVGRPRKDGGNATPGLARATRSVSATPSLTPAVTKRGGRALGISVPEDEDEEEAAKRPTRSPRKRY